MPSQPDVTITCQRCAVPVQIEGYRRALLREFFTIRCHGEVDEFEYAYEDVADKRRLFAFPEAVL